MEPKPTEPVVAPAGAVVEPAAPVVTPPAVDPAPAASIVQNASAPVSPAASAPDQKKVSKHSALIAVLLLIFVYPIGVLYVFMATAWPKWLKILLALPILLGIIGMIAFAVKSLFIH